MSKKKYSELVMRQLHKTVLLLSFTMSSAITQDKLFELRNHNPFGYDLAINVIPGICDEAPVMICCHGYGHNVSHATLWQEYKKLQIRNF